MSVGASVTKSDIDNAAASVSQSMFAATRSITQLKAYLDTQTDAALVTLGYTSGEVAVLRSAMNDLVDLAGVFNGSATAKTLPYDYRTFAKQLIGVRLY